MAGSSDLYRGAEDRRLPDRVRADPAPDSILDHSDGVGWAGAHHSYRGATRDSPAPSARSSGGSVSRASRPREHLAALSRPEQEVVFEGPNHLGGYALRVDMGGIDENAAFLRHDHRRHEQ